MNKCYNCPHEPHDQFCWARDACTQWCKRDCDGKHCDCFTVERIPQKERRKKGRNGK